MAGCPDDDYNVKTWTKKLGGKEKDEALTHIDQLGDPAAIDDLGEEWRKTREPKILGIIIGLASPLTPAEAKQKNRTDFDGEDGHAAGRPASWDAAMPYLTEAIAKAATVDESSQQKVEAAAKAATAIGASKSSKGLDALIDVASKPPTHTILVLQLKAIEAIGKFDTEKNKAADALIKIINNPNPPPHPRTIKDANEVKAGEARYSDYQKISALAINALGELHVTTASKTLMIALYRTPDLFDPIRRAMVATGPSAKEELIKILQGKNPEIEEYFKYNASKPKRESKAFYCGDKGELEDNVCEPVSAKEFYAATVLGDFYDNKTTPILLSLLDKEATPAYFLDGAPGPTQYHAVFAALMKMGDPAAADRVRGMWMEKAKDPKAAASKPGGAAAPPPSAGSTTLNKMLAVSAYPFVTRNDEGIKELGEIAAKNGENEDLRRNAAEAFSRMSRDPKDMKVMEDIAKRFYDESAKKKAEAEGDPKKKADEATKVFEAEKERIEKRTKEITDNPASTIQEIKARGKKAADEVKAAEKKRNDASKPYNDAIKLYKAYRSFARSFLARTAAIEVAVRCSKETNPTKCYVNVLNEKVEDAVTAMRPYIKELDDTEKEYQTLAKQLEGGGNLSEAQRKELQAKVDEAKKNQWNKAEKQALLQGQIERAMLEVGKKGTAASEFIDQLLDAAKSDDRLIRQSILLALPKIATLPCEKCEKKLDAAIKAGEGKSTLGNMQLDTQMLRNYFMYAK